MSLQAVAVLVNVLLAALKFTVGAAAGSRALVADALNSTGDVFATAVAWAAFRVGSIPPDESHPYGHDNAEALAGLLIGGMICGNGIVIAFGSLMFGHQEGPPEASALWAALATAAVKLVLYRTSIVVGRRRRSPTLLASAQDHIADVLAGLGAFAGILIARTGLPAADTAAAVAIGIWVFWAGIGPVRTNIGILMQEAPAGLAERATAVAASVPGVLRVVAARVQPIGGSFRMDLTIEVDGRATVRAGHDVAEAAAAAIRHDDESIREVHVHVEPEGAAHPELPR